MLRTQILQRTEVKGGDAVMITSALPGERKTLTAINLALTFAKAFSQAMLLVAPDLRLLPKVKILGLVLNSHKPTKKDATYYPKYYPKK